MDVRGNAQALVAAGLLLLVNPLYWEAARSTPGLSAVTAIADWLGAIGLVAAGSYYVGVGAAWTVTGLVGYGVARGRVDPERPSTVALLSTVPAVAATLATYAVAYGTATTTLVVEALAVAAVALGLPVGTTTGVTRSRLLVAAGALLVPWTVWVVVNVGSPPVGPAARYAYLSVLLVAVLDVACAVPAYRLGRRLSGPSHSRE
jgi:hypothetical protein